MVHIENIPKGEEFHTFFDFLFKFLRYPNTIKKEPSLRKTLDQSLRMYVLHLLHGQ
jgi:hypothetical protein